MISVNKRLYIKKYKYNVTHSFSVMCNLCCVKIDTSTIASGINKSGISYLRDSSYAYKILVS